ncbi:MAG: PAS domain-containing sensor histidine kinase [Anaerolineales bacterium]|nr:PAS domain-containing sensor histidine kinase [Anaerolineales bacterium]
MKVQDLFPTKLSVRLMFLLVGLVILTAAAVGFPGIWLINRQLNTQFWERLDNGRSASQALLQAERRDIDGLAQLTSQRPTLKRLLLNAEIEELNTYLATLASGADLDLVLVCSLDGEFLASSRPIDSRELCVEFPSEGVIKISDGVDLQVLLIGTSPIQEEGTDLARVVTGRLLDHSFAQTLQEQTGVKHVFWCAGEIITTSMALDQESDRIAAAFDSPKPGNSTGKFKVSIDGVPHFAARQMFEDSELVLDVALSVESLMTTRRRLEIGWIGGLLLVVVVGSSLGFLLSRQIGDTFNTLSSAAVSFQKGDLETPVHIDSDLEEATSVARALESARHTLNVTMYDLRKEKQWSDQLLDSIEEGIVILDEDRQIKFFSSGAERISGFIRADVLGAEADRFFQPVEQELTFSQLLPRKGGQSTLHLEMAGGRQSSLAISSAAFRPAGSHETETLLVLRDVSEKQAMHRLMGHFMGNISHEFRTPLSAIAASTELLMDQVDDLSKQELQELLASLHLGIVRLSALVDNLLESASIETGQFRVTPRGVDLAQIIAEAVQTMYPLIEKHGQKLDIRLPVSIPVVLADPRRTVQVFTNLLSNASKFGPDGSVIRIVARLVDESVVLEVQDRGPGVADEHRDYIFRRFSSVPREMTTMSYGVGLGLSVVKAIVEAQGGEVGVRENPEGGAIFWISIPLSNNP